MSALTGPRALTTRQDLGLLQFGIADNVVLFPGALAAVNASGYAQPATTSLAINIAGVYTGIQDGPVSNSYGLGTADNTGAGHVANAFQVALAQGAFGFNMGTAGDAVTIANIGSIMFAIDDQTVGLTDGGGTRSPAGVLVNVVGSQAVISVNLINIRYAFTTAGAVLTTTPQTITDHKTFSAAGAPYFNNAADTFHVVFASTVTANRTWTFPDASDTFVGVAATQTLTAKTLTTPTLTTPVIATGLTANGAGTIDFSGATSAFKTPVSASTLFTFGQKQAAGATTNTIADPGTGQAIPVTASGVCAITVASAGVETNTVAAPTFMGQRLTICDDTNGTGTRVVTLTGNTTILDGTNNTITYSAVGQKTSMEAITVGGALKWSLIANVGAALSHV